MLFSFTGFMPWDFSVPCSVILFELFFLSFSPAERSTDSERIILWVSHEIEEMDIIDAKSCNSVADDVSLVIEWSWLTAWTPGCLFRGLHTVFTKLWGYSTPLGIETFWSGEGLGWRARSTHAGADECWTPVRRWSLASDCMLLFWTVWNLMPMRMIFACQSSVLLRPFMHTHIQNGQRPGH